MSTDEHPPPSVHRPVPRCVLLSRLATARACHGTTADEPSRLARSRHRFSTTSRHAVAYLHERSPPIIHRDLSARNVLLNTGMVAKIGDLGVARIVPRIRVAATMTTAPGAGVYMPPEALENKADSEKEDIKHQSMMQASMYSPSVLCRYSLSAKHSLVTY